jgi:hypothetical protein
MFAQLLEDLDDASKRLAELAEWLRQDVAGPPALHLLTSNQWHYTGSVDRSTQGLDDGSA